MVCGYDKVKVGQNANRSAWNTCASKAEAARLDLTPTAPAAYAERPGVDRVFRQGPARAGLCRRLCSLHALACVRVGRLSFSRGWLWQLSTRFKPSRAGARR